VSYNWPTLDETFNRKVDYLQMVRPTVNRFRVLVADCPWQFNDQLADFTRGALTQYQTLSVEQLKRFPLPPLYESSTLFFWRVAAMQQEALDVIDAWDFEVKAEIVWKKLTRNGRRHFGMGRHVRMEHEVCLIATSGKPATLDKAIRSIFEAPTGGHSEKPEEFFKLVERMREGPYCELFARRLRAGWTCYGNELPNGGGECELLSQS
jgi:N6-adenosine-specific RNA methylase IME4